MGVNVVVGIEIDIGIINVDEKGVLLLIIVIGIVVKLV